MTERADLHCHGARWTSATAAIDRHRTNRTNQPETAELTNQAVRRPHRDRLTFAAGRRQKELPEVQERSQSGVFPALMPAGRMPNRRSKKQRDAQHRAGRSTNNLSIADAATRITYPFFHLLNLETNP
jgi:hypothetical protein